MVTASLTPGETCRTLFAQLDGLRLRPVTNRMVQRMAALGLLLTLMTVPSSAVVSTNVPLGHWSYDAVDKLANYGLIESSMLTMKPLSRMEMARHIAQAIYALDAMDDPPPLLRAIIERLEKEFQDELVYIGLLDGSYSDSAIKPLEDPYAKYVYAQDRTDIENIRGDEFQAGSNFRGGFASRGRLFDTLGFYLHPEYATPSPEGDVELIEGYGKAMLGPFEIEGGRDSLWWGPGHHGALLISNNAEPFTMLKISNPQPLRLPWIFRYIGLVKGQWFLTELEEDRDHPGAKLSGLRLALKPHPAVELGATRVVMFGGEGAPGVSWFEYIKNMIQFSEEQSEDNQLAGLDGSFLLPLPRSLPLRSVKLYGDFMGEDSVHSAPSRWSYLAGLQLNDILRTGRTDLRMEWAHTNPVAYIHGIYTSGYTYEGRVIGHFIGPNADDFFVLLSHYLTESLVVDLAYDELLRSREDGDVTKRILAANLTLFPSSDWRVGAGYRYERMRNDGDNHIVMLELVRRF
jgi:hypothetical protein